MAAVNKTTKTSVLVKRHKYWEPLLEYLGARPHSFYHHHINIFGKKPCKATAKINTKFSKGINMAKSSSLRNFRSCIAKTVRKWTEKSVAEELDSPQIQLRHLQKNESIHVLSFIHVVSLHFHLNHQSSGTYMKQIKERLTENMCV